MAYEFRIIKDLSPIRICVRSSSIFFSFLALLLRLLPITGQSDWRGQPCGADASALVLRLLDDSDNVLLNGKALNVLAKSSWPRGLQLLQNMARRKVGTSGEDGSVFRRLKGTPRMGPRFLESDYRCCLVSSGKDSHSLT